jgi:ACS family hexuronate transporter-like MFS transporter
LISAKPQTGFRWTICALIFFATTVNYLDRQLFSNLVPFFEDDLKLGPTDLALINVSFILPYGMAMLFVGRFIDRVGIKLGLAATYMVWTIALICHGFVRSIAGFIGIRFILGVGESGMYPGAVKTNTDWFPVKERSLANGIFNAGANMGAILAPILGVKIAKAYGWQAAFEVLGGVGIVWLLFWIALYRPPKNNPKVSESEYAYIHSDDTEVPERITYSQLFGMLPVYGLAIAKAVTDGSSWFILLWLPKILVDQFHVSIDFVALAIPVVYIIGDIGSVGGGWLSSRLLHRGWTVNRARKTVMLGAAACVVPVSFVGFLVDRPAIAGISCVYWAIAILALAAAAHQAWSSNLFTVISDTAPKSSMAMAVGAINGFAMFGVAAMQFFVGRMVQLTSSYTIPFMVAGVLYLVGFVFIQLFIPNIEPYPTTRRARMPYVIAGALIIIAALGYMQYAVSRPPYASTDDYLTVRQTELKATSAPEAGPTAQVGWMQSRWYLWHTPNGKTKLELVKLDTHGHPFVEEKGVKAPKYQGPTLAQVESDLK